MKIYFSILLFIAFNVFITSDIICQGIDYEEEMLNTRCLTYAPKELKQKLMDKLQITNPRQNGLQTKVVSNSGIFLIHYDTTGTNAVSLIDNNKNGIPDYVDSVAYYFDYVYDFYINKVGYLSPYPENAGGGSEQYDVYLLELGDGVYPETSYAFTEQDDEIMPQIHFPRYYTYILMDNNYSSTDSTTFSDKTKKPTYTETGIVGMKVTAAHEFHHAIQNMYGEPYPSSRCLNEMVSTFMEWRIFPDSKDYIQYVKSLFKYHYKYAFGNGNFLNGYRYCIFGQYAYLQFGDTLFLNMWRLIGDGIKGYKALDSAFALCGTSLDNEWCKFIEWLYYTDTRAVDGKYFADAKLFPLLTYMDESIFQSPSLMINGTLDKYAFAPYRCIFPKKDEYATEDTLDVIVTNLDLIGAIDQYPSISYNEFSIFCTDKENDLTHKIEGSEYYYGLIYSVSEFCDKLFYKSGIHTNYIGYAYPNPFYANKNEQLMFPVPANAKIYDKVDLHIYNVEMHSLFNTTLSVSVNEKNRVVILDKIPESLSSGVYIYKVISDDNEILGKFSIIR